MDLSSSFVPDRTARVIEGLDNHVCRASRQIAGFMSRASQFRELGTMQGAFCRALGRVAVVPAFVRGRVVAWGGTKIVPSSTRHRDWAAQGGYIRWLSCRGMRAGAEWRSGSPDGGGSSAQGRLGGKRGR